LQQLFSTKNFIDSYTNGTRRRKSVPYFMAKISADDDKELPRRAARITVTLKYGSKFAKEVIYVKGDEKPFYFLGVDHQIQIDDSLLGL
jgi:hypothetical protein